MKKRKRDNEDRKVSMIGDDDDDDDEGDCYRGSLKTAVRRLQASRVKSMNDQLAIYANRKQLREGEKLFQTMKKQGLANVHTYAIAINCFVRCEQIRRAEYVLEEMDKNEDTKPEIVTFTSLLKGYCNAERVQKDPQLRKARRLIDRMIKSNVIPNIRTCNTLLRGCLWVGASSVAQEILLQMTRTWKTKPDESSWEYVVTLLCQSFKLDKALKLVHNVTKTSVSSSSSMSMWCSVAQCAALLGEVNIAEEAISTVHRALSELTATTTTTTVATTTMQDSASTLSGGKRGWHRKSKIRRENQTSDSRMESNTAFRSHRADQTLRRVETIEGFLKDKNRLDLTKQPERLVKVLSFWFPDKKMISRRELSKGFLKSLVKRFGLSQLLKRSSSKISEKDMYKRISKSLTKQSHLKFEHIFAATTDSVTKRPVNIELGCGSGEWAAAQAIATTGRAYWVALELRHSRVYDVFARIVFENISNLCVVGGDAIELMSHHVAEETVSHFFVNHPEPPQQVANASFEDVARRSEGRHMLGSRCFRLMHAALESRGRVTIVTDNLWYGTTLLHVLEKAGTNLFESPNISGKDIELQARHGDHTLWVGSPGSRCGHRASDATSYFDRLWKKGLSQHASATERYFLYLKKR
jgi:pentatricopeptide repeat protein